MKRLFEDGNIIVRGIREISRIRPGLWKVELTRAVLEGILPFINLYLSAEILDELIRNNGKELIRLVLITVLANFFLTASKKILDRIGDIWKMEFQSYYEMTMSEKMERLSYDQMENPEIYRKREKINEHSMLNGGGLWRLLEISDLVRCVVTVGMSVAFVVPLFLSPITEITNRALSFLNSYGGMILLIAAVAANILVGMSATGKETANSFRIMDRIASFNQIYGFYFGQYLSNYHTGKEIRLYNEANLIEEESLSLLDDCRKTLRALEKNEIYYRTIAKTMTGIVSGIVYLFVGIKAFAGAFGVGSIVKYAGSISQCITGVTEMMDSFARQRANREALEAYFSFRDLPEQKHEGTDLPENTETGYEIRFDNVSFQYPGNSEFVLKNVNLTVKDGKKLAIVGKNGSGKTTFIKLLCRLYRPTDGQILLNGKDIWNYDYEAYLKLLAVVFQDYSLFAFPLGQNVAAALVYDQQHAREVLEQAGMKERLERMRKGLESCIYKDFDESGVEISGGEAQKIALARALYRNAPIVILDEPTAALDPRAEYEILYRFRQIVQKKTAIFISHRMAICRLCDEIAVFDQGRIVQYGNHESLMRETGKEYYELWNTQAQYYR